MPEASGPSPSHVQDRALLVEAAEAAGAIAMRAFGGAYQIEEKPDDQGPVTEIDHAVNGALARALRGARPSYGWLSEETADGPERLRAERVFIVDPIDGTRAFIAGQKGWGVSVAVAESGRIVAAAVHLPARAETFSAALGAGAFKDGARLASPREPADLSQAELLAARPALEPKHWPGGVPTLNRSFRSSLAWRLCLVAEGRFDAMLTIRQTWEWDIAAGALIAAEAGRIVTDASAAPLAFNARQPRTPGIMAAGPALHARLAAGRSEL